MIFISRSTIGGSALSQRQLAHHLVQRGHDVRFVVFDRRTPKWKMSTYELMADASVRLEDSALQGPVASLRDRLFTGTRRSHIDGLGHHHAAVPQNALRLLLDESAPDVVVASSVDRWGWRQIRRLCHERGVPTILYLREESSLGHLARGATPSALVSNTPQLAEEISAAGHPCEFIPSVIDVGSTETKSSRLAALAINPITLKGSDLLWKVARRLPQIPFVVQESWPLHGADLEAVLEAEAQLPNIEFRRLAPAGPGLYRDARVLLAPYLVNSRPRVVLEAQHNAIPVLGSDLPALVDAVGPGGLVLPRYDVDAWARAIATMWDDDDAYSTLQRAAAVHSKRPEVNAGEIAARFESLVERVTGRHGRRM